MTNYFAGFKKNLKNYYILAIFSVFLFFFSVIKTRYLIVDINDFLGIFSQLPIEFWCGYFLILFISLLVYTNTEILNDWIFLLVLFILGLYLFGIGIFFEENTRMAVSYYPFSEVLNLLSFQHIDIQSVYPLISYRFWPGMHFITATLILLLGAKLDYFIKFIPLFWVTIVILLVYTIGKKFKLSRNQSFLATFLFIFSFWIPQYYYSPQAVSFICFLLIFLFSIPLNNSSIKSKIISTISFAALVTSHLITPIFVLISSFFNSLRKKEITLFLIFSLIFLFYYLYLFDTFFNIGIFAFKTQIEYFDVLTPLNVKLTVPSEVKEITNFFRLSYLLLFSLLVLISLWQFIKNRERLDKDYIYYCIFWILGGTTILLINYGGEQFERAYLFCILPTIFLILFCIKNKNIFIICMVIVFCLHIPAHYGSESFEQTTTTELFGSKFFAEKCEIDNLGIEWYYSAFYDPSIVKKPTVYYIWMGEYYPGALQWINPLTYSDTIHNRMLYYLGIDPVKDYLDVKSSDYNLIYSNQAYKIYDKL
jgi:hypothetical protein